MSSYGVSAVRSRSLELPTLARRLCKNRSKLGNTLLAGVGLYFLLDWWWADAVGALAMLPVILWQGWETLGEAREREHDHDDTGHRRGK